MRAVFASSDIATLVAAFPPSPSTKGESCLLKNQKDDTLLDSRTIVSRFRSLIDLSLIRINVSELAHQLNICETGWLLQVEKENLHYSRDKQFLIPGTQIRDLGEIVKEAAFIDLIQFSEKHDIASPTVEWLLQEAKTSDSESFQRLDGNESFLYRPSYAQNVKHDIEQLLMNSEMDDARPVNVYAGLSQFALPLTFVRKLLEEVVADQDNRLQGTVDLQNSSIMFVPAKYGEIEYERKKQDYQNHVESLVSQISNAGYCVLLKNDHAITKHDLEEDIVSTYREKYADDQDLALLGDRNATSQGLFILSRQETLQSQLDEIGRNAGQHIKETWKTQRESRKESEIIDDTILATCQDSGVPSDFSTVLISSPAYIDSIREMLTKHIHNMQQADTEQFYKLVQHDLLAEINLYASGHATIADATLHTNLEDYLGEELRRYIVPEAIAVLRKNTHLLDKSRTRDIDRFQQAIQDAKTFKDVHSAATKFAKKQKIDNPSPSTLREVKIETLRQKCRLMRQNTTGSFLLQNLTWILLSLEAQRAGGAPVEAKFMSAGKDTTRMIKQYQARGDATLSKQLMQWRDLLKAGGENAKDLQEMRNEAEKAVREIEAES
nr:hypothetical protein CFP56_20557 [Quercus suber]